jgi:hypothetical protein
LDSQLSDAKLVSRAACRREAVATLDTSFAAEHQRPSGQGRKRRPRFNGCYKGDPVSSGAAVSGLGARPTKRRGLQLCSDFMVKCEGTGRGPAPTVTRCQRECVGGSQRAKNKVFVFQLLLL